MGVGKKPGAGRGLQKKSADKRLLAVSMKTGRLKNIGFEKADRLLRLSVNAVELPKKEQEKLVKLWAGKAFRLSEIQSALERKGNFVGETAEKDFVRDALKEAESKRARRKIKH